MKPQFDRIIVSLRKTLQYHKMSSPAPKDNVLFAKIPTKILEYPQRPKPNRLQELNGIHPNSEYFYQQRMFERQPAQKEEPRPEAHLGASKDMFDHSSNSTSTVARAVYVPPTIEVKNIGLLGASTTRPPKINMPALHGLRGMKTMSYAKDSGLLHRQTMLALHSDFLKNVPNFAPPGPPLNLFEKYSQKNQDCPHPELSPAKPELELLANSFAPVHKTCVELDPEVDKYRKRVLELVTPDSPFIESNGPGVVRGSNLPTVETPTENVGIARFGPWTYMTPNISRPSLLPKNSLLFGAAGATALSKDVLTFDFSNSSFTSSKSVITSSRFEAKKFPFLNTIVDDNMSWGEAVEQARGALGIEGFCPVGGSSTNGKALLSEVLSIKKRGKRGNTTDENKGSTAEETLAQTTLENTEAFPFNTDAWFGGEFIPPQNINENQTDETKASNMNPISGEGRVDEGESAGARGDGGAEPQKVCC